MFLVGAGEIDLTRALSQKVTSVVPTVTYFSTIVTQNVLPKTKFVTIVVRNVIMHVVVGQKVRCLRADVLQKIHEGHQGVTTCQERTHQSVCCPSHTQLP